jgi:hypothetical protein
MAQQQQTPMQATDTFVATLKDGSDHLVTKGQILPFGHELVKRDREGSGTLFRTLDLGGDEPEPEEPKSAPEKAEAPPEPVKAPPGRASASMAPPPAAPPGRAAARPGPAPRPGGKAG